jgi:signal transduction histidine kinase
MKMHSMFVRFQRLGLQRRIMLYVSGGLVVVSAAFGLVGLEAIRQSTELVFQERLVIARTVAHQMDNDLNHLLRELNEAAANVGAALAADRQNEARDVVHTLHQHWSLYHRFDNPCIITLTDPNGVVLWSEPYDPELLSRNLSARSYLQRAFQTKQPTIADGLVPDASGRSSLSLAMPIRVSERVVGFLLGDINLSHISERLSPTLQVREPGYTLELINDSGLVLASTRRERQWTLSHHLELIAEMLGRDQSGVTTHLLPAGAREKSHVVAFAPLDAPRWGVVVEQEEDAALVLPHALQNQVIVFGVLALAAGLILAWVTTRAVVRPVNALIHASQSIASGDLDHPLDIAGEDEVGVLARAFDEMRVALKQSREEIARWNRELEARVQQRTRELTALVESSHALTSTLELDALFEILMKGTREVFPAAEGIALFLSEDASQMLVMRSTLGIDASQCLNLRFRPGEAIAGQVFERQTAWLLKTAVEVEQAQANFGTENREHFLRAIKHQPVQSALGVPLVSKGTCVGSLVLYNWSRPWAFAESDVPILQALADQAAAAIENARLYQEAREVGALRELNRLKSEFVARASHELRTPLTAIKSLAESLLRRELNLDAATQQEFLQGIDTATDRLTRIVDQLLTLARVEVGKIEIRREPIDVSAILARVVAQFRAQMPARPIRIVNANDLLLALGDAARVEDIVTNLLSNALKYSAADTAVEIRAHAEDRRVVIAVADAGIGIPRAARDKVFERFYRVDNALTRRVEGAGLGLYICKTYVEAMGGTIQVEGEDGRGSVFTFSLPVNKT